MKNYRFSLDLLQVNLGFIMGFVACNLKNPALKSNKRSEAKWKQQLSTQDIQAKDKQNKALKVNFEFVKIMQSEMI